MRRIALVNSIPPELARRSVMNSTLPLFSEQRSFMPSPHMIAFTSSCNKASTIATSPARCRNKNCRSMQPSDCTNPFLANPCIATAASSRPPARQTEAPRSRCAWLVPSSKRQRSSQPACCTAMLPGCSRMACAVNSTAPCSATQSLLPAAASHASSRIAFSAQPASPAADGRNPSMMPWTAAASSPPLAANSSAASVGSAFCGSTERERLRERE
mmetsp:Transcript_125762/g.280980  ORF Transcript_125762/g.280980 Transcript_125762/m.280980 type:complete len:215 (-) Transcript_125762:82-726(-)